jgi:hypothetical protein
VNRQIKILFLIGFFLALSYIFIFCYSDSRQSLVIATSCQKTGDEFSLVFKRSQSTNKKINVLNLRPGLITIRTKQKINDLEFVTYDDLVVKADKVNDHLFQKSIKTNLVVSSIRLLPKSISLSRIDVNIYRKPLFSIYFVLFQFVFLFMLFSLGLLTIYFLFSLMRKGESIQNISSKIMLFPVVMIFLTLFIYVVLNPGKFLNKFNLHYPLEFFTKAVLFNVGLALSLLALYFILSLERKRDKLPFYLPVIVVLPILFIKIPYAVKASADSLLWVLNLTFHKMEISFAESLSLMLNKFTFYLFNLVTHVRAEKSLVYTGKLIGILFIFSLFFFINSFAGFSYKKKLLFFILFLTFGFNILLFGFPEFRYYALPFLMFSFLEAKKYIGDRDGNIKFLIGSAVLAVLAGLFHGIAYFSFPIILLLPLLKRQKDKGRKKGEFYLKQYSAIVLTVGTVFLIFLATINIFGFDLKFNTAVGGFDGRQFISFLPVDVHFPEAVNFLEVGYFISRGWILFITGAFIFLLFISHWKKKISLETSDFILFLFGVSQFLIVLFWGFDNGINEFDLYIVPPTLIYLFLIRYLLETIRSEKNSWKYITIFSLFSPLYLLFVKVIGT